MKTIEIDNLLLVEVPKDASDFKDTGACGIYFKLNNGDYDSIYFDDIFCPADNYEIIGLIETPDLIFDFDIDDSMVKNIGNNPLITGNAYPNYINKYQFFETKKESFKTRIQRKIQDAVIELTGNLLLIKKLK